MSGEGEELRWVILWNAGILVGLIGLPAMLGFLAGTRLELATRGTVPWRVLFAALGVLVGALAAWRALITRRRT
jgi:hypothetical protein